MSVHYSDQRALEHYTMKTAYEQLAKTFKSGHKDLDKGALCVKDAASQLTEFINRDTNQTSMSSAVDGLSNVLLQLKAFKRKFDESVQAEAEALKVCKKRVLHLKSGLAEPNSEAAADYRAVCSERLIVDHLLRCGFYDTASLVASTAQIEDLTAVGLFHTAMAVETSLLERSTEKCLEFCQSYKAKLSKMKSNLELNVRIQEFVEMIKLEQREAAIRHAQQYIVPLAIELQQTGIIGHVMALVAFDSSSCVDKYKCYFDDKRWQQLVGQFRTDFLRCHELSIDSPFSVVLQLGLSAFKTYSCYDKQLYNANCPVCNANFNQLARRVPPANYANSKVLCPVSGLALDENNQPMVLPNGQVCGQLALLEMASANSGKITCPKTGQVFEFDQCKKIFIV